MVKEEQLFQEGEEQAYMRPVENETIPVSTDQQLGQDILRTFARISDPNMIKFKKIRKRVPVFATKTITTKGGRDKAIEYIDKWEVKEWEIPIIVQPKYHELITDDMSRAFLNETDLGVCRDVAAYCQMIKSFADRYDLDLALHHNNFVDENNYLVVSSGAYKGKRVELAKTNRIESSYRADTIQMLGQQPQKKKDLLSKLGI